MSNQVALITGAASGIGKAVALKVASGGTSVVISGRRQDLGNDAVAAISAGGFLRALPHIRHQPFASQLAHKA